MEGIELAFPLSICRDILENPTRQGWRFYQASISSGKKDGKKTLGALRTRVVSSEDDQFVDLILAFPRHTIKCPAVRGNLRCRAEILKNISETNAHFSPESETESAAGSNLAGRDETEYPRKSKVRNEKSSKEDGEIFPDENTDTDVDFEDGRFGASHNISCERENSSKSKRIKKRERIHRSALPTVQTATTQGKRVVSKYDKLIRNLEQASANSVLETLSVKSKTRPARHREKPSKYKDFVASSELSTLSAREQVEKEVPNFPTSPGTDASHVDFEDGRLGASLTISHGKKNTRKSKKTGKRERLHWSALPAVQTSTNQGKRVVRKYDKLIRNLQQASRKSGLEMLSVISGFKSVADPEKTEADITGTHDLNENDEQACEVLPTASTGRNGSSSVTMSCHRSANAMVARKKHPGIGKLQRRLAPRTNPYLTSFPRKFPSSLTRTDVLDISRAKTQKASPQKKQSVDAEGADEILSKDKKREPAKESSGVGESEEEYLDDDNDEDFVPSGEDGEDSDPDFEFGEKSKKSKSTQLHKHQTPDCSTLSATQQSVAMVAVGSMLSQNQGKLLVSLPVVQQDRKVHAVLMGPVQKLKQASGDQSHSQPSQTSSSGRKQQRPVVPAMADHDYTDIVLGKKVAFSNKALRTLVRPISLTRHISARVERVEEGEGSSLVTISGLNSKAAGGDPSHDLTLRFNHEGLPIADTLEDVMTDTFKRREKQLQSLQQAETACVSPEVYIDVDEMPAMNEVVLTPSGHQQPLRNPRATRGRPRKYPLLTQGISTAASASHQSAVFGCHDDSVRTVKVKGEAKTVILQMTQAGWTEVEHGWKNNADKEELIQQGLIGVNFEPGQEIKIDNVSPPRGSLDTVVENEHEVILAQQSPTTKFCKYCLRMFPASAILFKHVKTAHVDYADSSEHQEYLETLRRDNRMVCPYCPGGHTLSNEYKLRSHLAQYHGDQMDHDLGEATLNAVSPQCEVCQVHFHTLSELKAHATLIHNTTLFTCCQCPAVFVRDTSLSTHMKDMHAGQSSRSFVCKTCDTTFDSKHLLQAHKQMVHSHAPKQLRVETTESIARGGCKPSETPQLGKAGTLVHATNEDARGASKQVKCPCCDAHFSHSWELHDHRRQIHTGPVPVHCIFCGLGYQSLTPMYKHLKHHFHSDTSKGTKSSLLCCPFCDSAAVFTSEASLLVSHVVGEHQDVFHYVCSVCQQRFHSEDPLHIHLQQAHELSVPGKMYSLLSGSSSTAQVPATYNANLDGSSTLLNAAGRLLIPGAPSDESALSPTQEDMSSDIFHNLPTEAQESIRFITQLGKKAVLTITDGKGNVQRVSFKQDEAIPTSSKPVSPPLPTYAMQDANLECSETVVEEGVVALGNDMVLEETGSVVENLVYGMNFSTGTEGLTGARDVDSATELATTELVAEGSTDAMEVSEEAHHFGVAMETEVNSDTLRVAGEMEVVTESLHVGGETDKETTAYELVDSGDEMSTPPEHFVLIREGEGGGEGALDETRFANASEGAELARVAVQTSDDGTITVSAEDLLKLIRGSQPK
ncbi:uncharacterized protein [Littorina saxatilis]|uniref:C2H2-type domain-containing protein n=1 Tax=Littorina saxatilis TaxID=31220 RepID=A0AAN9G110_9CAEN